MSTDETSGVGAEWLPDDEDADLGRVLVIDALRPESDDHGSRA
jgi:hypothetical protein